VPPVNGVVESFWIVSTGDLAQVDTTITELGILRDTRNLGLLAEVSGVQWL
jgi:hypothetical protein